VLDRPGSRPPPKPPPTGQAVRSRRYRRRVRDHQMVPAMPPIGIDEIEFLVRTRWLDEEDAHDRRAVGLAIAALLRETARLPRRR
jgi:hypothetical protein